MKTVEIVFRNDYFQFSGKVKPHVSGNAIKTKFAPIYACVFMGQRAQKASHWCGYAILKIFSYMDSQKILV